MKKTSLQRKVEKLEYGMMKTKAKLAKLRQKLPLEEFGDSELMTSDGRKTTLSKLFGGKKELILIHNMGSSCPYCTMWADGFNGVLHHLKGRAAFAVESPDAPTTQKKFRSRRGWKFAMVSSRGTGFRKRSGFQTREGDPMPGVSIFVKGKDGGIYRGSRAYFGPGDNFCNVWDLMDLLPKRAARWEPSFRI